VAGVGVSTHGRPTKRSACAAAGPCCSVCICSAQIETLKATDFHRHRIGRHRHDRQVEPIADLEMPTGAEFDSQRQPAGSGVLENHIDTLLSQGKGNRGADQPTSDDQHSVEVGRRAEISRQVRVGQQLTSRRALSRRRGVDLLPQGRRRLGPRLGRNV
jgi:hypothetical protein